MTESWWLKLDRAQKHFDELQAEIGRYAMRRPYRAERVRQPHGQRHIWRYVIRFTEQPDPNLALVIGDIVHNLRSALDHLAVAMSDKAHRSRASFPIESRDLWEKDPKGTFLVPDDEARERFKEATRGMTPEAVALVKEMQPYNSGDKAPVNALSIIGTIDNADKHREIAKPVPGLHNSTTVLTVLFNNERVFSNGMGFRYDGAEIGQFDLSTSIITPKDWPKLEAEAQVQVYGPLHVSLEVGNPSQLIDALELGRCLGYLRDDLVPALVEHVR